LVFTAVMSGFGQDDGFYSGGYDNQNQNQDISYGQSGYAQEYCHSLGGIVVCLNMKNNYNLSHCSKLLTISFNDSGALGKTNKSLNTGDIKLELGGMSSGSTACLSCRAVSAKSIQPFFVYAMALPSKEPFSGLYDLGLGSGNTKKGGIISPVALPQYITVRRCFPAVMCGTARSLLVGPITFAEALPMLKPDSSAFHMRLGLSRQSMLIRKFLYLLYHSSITDFDNFDRFSSSGVSVLLSMMLPFLCLNALDEKFSEKAHVAIKLRPEQLGHVNSCIECSQFGQFDYNQQGYGVDSSYGQSSGQPGYNPSILTPDQSAFAAPPTGDNYEDEPPLMEELGINFDHIVQKAEGRWLDLHLVESPDRNQRHALLHSDFSRSITYRSPGEGKEFGAEHNTFRTAGHIGVVADKSVVKTSSAVSSCGLSGSKSGYCVPMDFERCLPFILGVLGLSQTINIFTADSKYLRPGLQGSNVSLHYEDQTIIWNAADDSHRISRNEECLQRETRLSCEEPAISVSETQGELNPLKQTDHSIMCDTD
ncbi:YIPF5-like protein, partial [Mya arenaria]